MWGYLSFKLVSISWDILSNLRIVPLTVTFKMCSVTKKEGVIMVYLEKTNKHKEKGEKILFTSGLDEIQEVKAKDVIFEQIGLLLAEGLKPTEIMEQNSAFRRYEKLIKSEYLARRIKNTPLIKDMRVEWHFGSSRTGKSFEYIKLCEQYSPEDIYFCNDFENGGFDLYIESGAAYSVYR